MPASPLVQRLITADNNGVFEFHDVPAGDYTLTTEYPGFAPDRRCLHVTPDEDADRPAILLTRGGTIVVRVAGRAVAGELVRIVGEGVEITGATNEHGEFAAAHLAQGTYAVDWHAQGRTGLSQTTKIVYVRDDEIRETTFDASLSVVGSVIGAEGYPLPGAMVRFYAGGLGAEEPSPDAATLTDAAGDFEICGIDRDLYLVLVRLPSAEIPLGFIDMDRDRVSAGLLRLRETSVAGSVVFPGRDTTLPVEILACPVDEAGFAHLDLRAKAWADEAGRFRFVGLAPGAYVLRVNPPTSGLIGGYASIVLGDGCHLCSVSLVIEEQ